MQRKHSKSVFFSVVTVQAEIFESLNWYCLSEADWYQIISQKKGSTGGKK